MSPRTKEQFEQIRADRKVAIMDAALEMFAREGYHSSSISKIAKEAGISKGLMYNYFDSKFELLKELLNTLFDKILASMEMDVNQELTDEVMIGFIHKTFEVIDADRRLYRLYFSMITQEEVLEISKAQLMPRSIPFQEKMVNYFVKKSPEDPMTFLRYFSATMDGAKMQYMFDPEHFPLEPIKTKIINQFILNK